MRIRQYAYFGLVSDRMPAHEMTGRLGVEPDRIAVRASRRIDPPVPRAHMWEVRCMERGLTVEEQFAYILDRLEPYADRIAALVAELGPAPWGASPATLQSVRYFDDEDGEEEIFDPPDPEFVRITARHQLLGVHLDRRVIGFLHRVGAELDVDEYD